MECPKCKLINPPSALKCDCGYDFVENKPYEKDKMAIVNSMISKTFSIDQFIEIKSEYEKHNDGSTIEKYAYSNKLIKIKRIKGFTDSIKLIGFIDRSLEIEIKCNGDFSYYYINRESIDELKQSHQNILIENRINTEITKDQILEKLRNEINDIKPNNIKKIVQDIYNYAKRK